LYFFGEASMRKLLVGSWLTVRLLPMAAAAVLAACGNDPSQRQSADTVTEQSEAVRQAELDARAAALARREAELAAKELEQENERLRAEVEAAKREQEEAARVAAAKEAAAKKAARARLAAANQSAAAQPAVMRADAAPVLAPAPLHIQAGTPLAIALSSELSSKTSQIGETFEGSVASDLWVGDRIAVPAGTRVVGNVTEVISGANSIGAVPLLALRLDRLELADGRSIPIRGEFQQQGKSEKGRDAAKIVGGAAAGAVIGHQVRHDDKGKVIGGILGGALGTAIAKKTGTEVQLPAGSQLNIVLSDGFSVTRS
jgi:type IV secretory pathway VirB10-like protein